MSEPVPSQLFPVIVGVSGHIDIVPTAEPAIRAAVVGVLAELRQTYGAALHVLTALAEGADQLVAQEARALGIRIIAALPMKMARYAATLPSDAGRAVLVDFWEKADLQLQLPEIGDPAASDYDELHYEQLGVLLARRSHLLLALWNGDAPTASTALARGGTADVIAMRAGGIHDRVAARHSPWFAQSITRLDLSRGGPVLQIVTPRVKNGGAVAVPGESAPPPGSCFLLPKPPRLVRAGTLLATFDPDDALDFRSLASLNQQIGAFQPLDTAVYQSQLNELKPDGVVDPTGKAMDHLDQMRHWQAVADAAAQRFQRRLLGQFAPAPKWSGLLVKGWNVLARNWNQNRPPGLRWWQILRPRFGAIFVFTALVPAAVFLFELHIGDDYNPAWLLAYLLLFAFAIIRYWISVVPDQWQDRFQDYRALAEAMRVQIFWGAAAVPDGVADYTLRQQRGELGWINFALRGPALWGAGLAHKIDRPHRALVTRGWIEHQQEYFVGKSDKPGAAQKNAAYALASETWSKWLLYIGLGIAVVMLVIETLRSHGDPQLLPHDFAERAKHGLEYLAAAAAVAPALSAFFALWSELRAYAAHSHSYRLMGRLFDHARAARQESDAEFKELVHELGREALSENAEWLLDHRRRKIDPKAG